MAGEIVHFGFHAAGLQLALVECDGLRGIFGGVAFGSRQFEEAVVGLRIHHIVLDFHYLAVGGAHQGCRVVAVAEVVAGLAGFLLHVFLAVGRLGVHGNEGGEAVSAVDVKALGYGAKSVGGIDVPAVFLVVLHAPAEFLGVVGWVVHPL